MATENGKPTDQTGTDQNTDDRQVLDDLTVLDGRDAPNLDAEEQVMLGDPDTDLDDPIFRSAISEGSQSTLHEVERGVSGRFTNEQQGAPRSGQGIQGEREEVTLSGLDENTDGGSDQTDTPDQAQDGPDTVHGDHFQDEDASRDANDDGATGGAPAPAAPAAGSQGGTPPPGFSAFSQVAGEEGDGDGTPGTPGDDEPSEDELVGDTVDVTAEAPSLSMTDAAGVEDQSISLNLSAALTDTDGSESLSITIGGVPSGATLSAGINNGDGTWTLTAADLPGLTVTPPANSDVDFQLTVTATSTEGGSGATATSTGTIDVSVAADADAPTLTLNDASGTEDQAISLNLSSALTDTDGSESLSITIGGVPSGATLSAGTNNGDGTWTLEPGDLAGLTITPPANSDADFQLTVTATSTEADGGDTATTSGTVNVSVAADADAPTLTLNDA
ncbi:MAG: hypothetical protein KDE22_06305, partial [Rhodobacterales bacterium]|nr:hypothetical protein [Rhodobacterales bacterium]